MKCAASDEPVLGTCWLDPKLDPGSPAACHDLFDAFPPPLPQLEVKPLPPFPAYTGHLSINGISGHHFHAISQRLPEENNNYPTQSGYGLEQDIVTSTCSDPPDLDDVKPFPLDETDTKPFGDLAGAPDSCTVPCSPPTKLFEDNPKQEMYDIKSFEDIAALIGASIVDTTSQPEDPDNSCDSWLDLDKLINGHYNQHGEKIVPLDDIGLGPSPTSMSSSNHQSGLEFYCKPSQEFTKNQELDENLGQAGSTLHRLLTQSYMPILQTYKDRLQVKQEAPSSTSYGMDVITNSSPPCNVVSTTNGVGSLLHGRYAANYGLSLKQDGLCSPERLLGYPHAHTTTGSNSSKSKGRSRAKPKHNNAANLHAASLAFSSATAAELSSLLGKEGKDKPMHRCGICNRGFLNKSNIKVHLRTHTGEKPFRCDVCAKAFRQKAHLIKHQQIHKRIGRD